MKRWLVLSICLLAPHASLADDDFDFGDTFEEEADPGPGIPLRGKLMLGAGYQLGEPHAVVSLDSTASLILDWSGSLGRLSGEGDIEINGAHWLEERSDFTQEHYTLVGLLRALQYSYAWKHVSLHVGQLMTVWSAGDLIPILDVLTAVDTTEGFFARPEQYRLGQVGTKLDFYRGAHTVSLLWHAWPQMNRIVQGDHPYSLTMGLEGIDLTPEWDPAEFAARWTLRTDGGDITLMGGRVFERNPIIGLDLTAPSGIGAHYESYNFVGAALTHAVGPVLLKSELSWSPSAPIMAMNQPSAEKHATFKAMAGIDYNHEKLGTLIAETNIVHAGEGGMNSPDGTTLNAALMWSNRFWRDQLTLSIVGLLFGSFDNRVIRASLDYQVLDELSISTQGTLIEYPDLSIVENWDRIDCSLVWAFDLAGS